VVARPDLTSTVDVPIVTGVVIERSVLGVAAAGAAAVVLPPAQTGEETRTPVFSDGGFYQRGMRPGRYRICGEHARKPVTGFIEIFADGHISGESIVLSLR
jgi:hypothetical protein